VVTDLVSVFFVQNSILTERFPNGVLTTAYLFYMACTTAQPEHLIAAIAAEARAREAADVLNILPIGVITEKMCKKIGAERGTGVLKYFAYNMALREPISSTKVFLFPGV
jgi:hypothetical protein